MSGETFNQQPEEAPGASQWDILADYSGPSKFNPDYETNVGSAIQKTGERIATSTSRFIEGWRTNRAQRKSEQLAKQNEILDTSADKIQQRLDKTMETATDRLAELGTAEENIGTLLENREQAKTQFGDLRSEYSVGNYVRTQSEQVGSILKANSNALKAGLGYFKSKILSKIPKIEISVQTADDVATQNWQENVKAMSAKRREAKSRLSATEQAKVKYEQAKASRKEAIKEMVENRSEQTAGFGQIANLVRELASNSAKLAKAKAERSLAQQKYDSVKERRSKLEHSLSSVMAEQAQIGKEKSAADEKVAKIQERSDRLEALKQFQNALQNRSPRIIRKNLESKLLELESRKSERLEDILTIKGVDDISELDSNDKTRVEKILKKNDSVINTVKEQLSALDQYEELKTGRVEKLVANPTVKKGTSRTFPRMRRMAAAAVIGIF